ncbi:MAG: TRAP transporter small permease subunit [Proteobacteria bacterium]|nr:TRAP transporter small permease subunit [Pseudomonadota bacterium]
MDRLRTGFRIVLEVACLLILLCLLVVVVVAVVARYSGLLFSWYDELASILLAWLTYFGAALAALRRAHLGFDNAMRALPPRARRIAFVLAEAMTIGFFACLGWGGWALLDILVGETLVSMPFVHASAVQSVIPLASAVFVMAEMLSMPEAWRRYADSPAHDHQQQL